MRIGRFQCGVASLIYHVETGLIFCCVVHTNGILRGRLGKCDGPRRQGESFEQAVYREVREEVGLESRSTLSSGQHALSRRTHAGKRIARGQIRLLGCFTRKTPISAEHDEAQWLTADEIYMLLPPDHWLTQTIRRAEMLREALHRDVIAYQRQYGFEMIDRR